MPKFTKSERLLKSGEFSSAYKKGRKASVKNFSLHFLAGQKRRLGLTVSKKVGKANLRNYIKRHAREFFRLNKEKFPLGDCVITAFVGAGELTPQEIRIELAKLVEKIL